MVAVRKVVGVEIFCKEREVVRYSRCTLTMVSWQNGIIFTLLTYVYSSTCHFGNSLSHVVGICGRLTHPFYDLVPSRAVEVAADFSFSGGVTLHRARSNMPTIVDLKKGKVD